MGKEERKKGTHRGERSRGIGTWEPINIERRKKGKNIEERYI